MFREWTMPNQNVRDKQIAKTFTVSFLSNCLDSKLNIHNFTMFSYNAIITNFFLKRHFIFVFFLNLRNVLL